MDFRAALDDGIEMIRRHRATLHRAGKIERGNVIFPKCGGAIRFEYNGGDHRFPVRSLSGKLRFRGDRTFVLLPRYECGDIEIYGLQSRAIDNLMISQIENDISRGITGAARFRVEFGVEI